MNSFWFIFTPRKINGEATSHNFPTFTLAPSCTFCFCQLVHPLLPGFEACQRLWLGAFSAEGYVSLEVWKLIETYKNHQTNPTPTSWLLKVCLQELCQISESSLQKSDREEQSSKAAKHSYAVDLIYFWRTRVSICFMIFMQCKRK